MPFLFGIKNQPAVRRADVYCVHKNADNGKIYSLSSSVFCKTMTADSAKRLTESTALSHPALDGYVSPVQSSCLEPLSNLKKYCPFLFCEITMLSFKILFLCVFIPFFAPATEV